MNVSNQIKAGWMGSIGFAIADERIILNGKTNSESRKMRREGFQSLNRILKIRPYLFDKLLFEGYSSCFFCLIPFHPLNVPIFCQNYGYLGPFSD